MPGLLVKVTAPLIRKKEEKEEELKEEFFKEEKNILNRISFFESILETKEGSFKEFLIQNVENWEVELYPILDDNLLSKSVEELKPKIISDTIWGIKLDTTKLKTIPTMTKAEEEIEDSKNLKWSRIDYLLMPRNVHKQWSNYGYDEFDHCN